MAAYVKRRQIVVLSTHFVRGHGRGAGTVDIDMLPVENVLIKSNKHIGDIEKDLLLP